MDWFKAQIHGSPLFFNGKKPTGKTKRFDDPLASRSFSGKVPAWSTWRKGMPPGPGEKVSEKPLGGNLYARNMLFVSYNSIYIYIYPLRKKNNMDKWVIMVILQYHWIHWISHFMHFCSVSPSLRLVLVGCSTGFWYLSSSSRMWSTSQLNQHLFWNELHMITNRPVCFGAFVLCKSKS